MVTLIYCLNRQRHQSDKKDNIRYLLQETRAVARKPRDAAKFGCVPFGVDPRRWSLQRDERLGQSAVKLFSKNSNLCDHDTSTSWRDGRTDNLPWQYRALRSIAR